MLTHKLFQSSEDVGNEHIQIFAPVFDIFRTRGLHSMQLRKVVKGKDLQKNFASFKLFDAE
jgi:hypothetical protein